MQIDEHINWIHHYHALNSKLSRAIYTLNKVKNVLPSSCMKMLYFTLFHSHLCYGIMLWGPNMSAKYKKKIFVNQKKIIRIIHNKSHGTHTVPLFQNSKILQLSDLIEVEILKFMFKYYSNTLPEPLMQLFNTNKTRYNTRQSRDPQPPLRNYEPLNKSFLCRGPTLWNSLSNNLKAIKDFKYFAKKVKAKYSNM